MRQLIVIGLVLAGYCVARADEKRDQPDNISSASDPTNMLKPNIRGQRVLVARFRGFAFYVTRSDAGLARAANDIDPNRYNLVVTNAAWPDDEHATVNVIKKVKSRNTTIENAFPKPPVPNNADRERIPTAPVRVDPPAVGFFEWMKGVDREYLSDYDKTDYWAAIAYSPSTGRYGTYSEARGRDTALRASRDFCKADDARPVVLVGNGWCALAVGRDTSAWGVGWGPDRSTAEEYALEAARERTTDCRIAVSIFARN